MVGINHCVVRDDRQTAMQAWRPRGQWSQRGGRIKCHGHGPKRCGGQSQGLVAALQYSTDHSLPCARCAGPYVHDVDRVQSPQQRQEGDGVGIAPF